MLSESSCFGLECFVLKAYVCIIGSNDSGRAMPCCHRWDKKVPRGPEKAELLRANSCSTDPKSFETLRRHAPDFSRRRSKAVGCAQGRMAPQRCWGPVTHGHQQQDQCPWWSILQSQCKSPQADVLELGKLLDWEWHQDPGKSHLKLFEARPSRNKNGQSWPDLANGNVLWPHPEATGTWVANFFVCKLFLLSWWRARFGPACSLELIFG